jgi:hypothetical protein
MLYAERYLGGGTRTYSSFSDFIDVSPACHPQSGSDTFPLQTFWIEGDSGLWLKSRLTFDHIHHYYDGRRFLLPVHPDALSCDALLYRNILQAAAPGPLMRVSPAANVRTVFVHSMGDRPVAPHWLKLHYPRRLSRFTRRLRQRIIELELWVSDELHRVSVPTLAEVAGGVIGADPAERWGFLLREATPRHEALPPGSEFFPCFALYGTDHFEPARPPLLAQLIERSGEPAEAFLIKRILEPLITMWIKALRSAGLILETHGQNTLFAYHQPSGRSAVIYRDCALYVVPELRRREGLPLDYPAKNILGLDVEHPAPQMLSLVYDRFMGNHFLAYVARIAEERFHLPADRLKQAAREIFRASIGDLASLFPAREYYYSDRLLPNNKWELVDTGRDPAWR